MKQLIEDFDKELLHALSICDKITFKQTTSTISTIVVSGMGGSGIGGSIVYALLAKQISCPFIVNKSYSLPTFVNEHSLVIICSYSGNTEESIQAFNEALVKNATIVCITSGGALLDLAIQHDINHIIIPSGRPPRASLGYSLVHIMATLIQYNIIESSVLNQVKEISTFIKNEQVSIKSICTKLAEELSTKLPVFYCEDKIEAIAIRWKQQLNENSKMLCWHNVYPELDHNELVGWREKQEHLALLMITTGDEYNRVKHRMELNEPVFQKITPHIHHIEAVGETLMEKIFYLIHFGDWLSYFLAEKRAYDPNEIDVLIQLKNDLSNIK
ncbi:MAG: bifunctional phosphoglucose/phosphomannose isomerase [Bacteroidota bacterium]